MESYLFNTRETYFYPCLPISIRNWNNWAKYSTLRQIIETNLKSRGGRGGVELQEKSWETAKRRKEGRPLRSCTKNKKDFRYPVCQCGLKV